MFLLHFSSDSFISVLFLPLEDSAAGSPTEVLNQEAISLSCHAYRRPVSALIAIKSKSHKISLRSLDQEETKGKDSTSNNPGSFLVVAVGHDYAYIPTSTPASRAYAATSSLVTGKSAYYLFQQVVLL